MGNEFENPYAESEFGRTRADDETGNGKLKFNPGDKKVIRFVSSKVEHKIHWKVIPKHGRIICRKTLGKDEECPICDYLNKIQAKDGWARWGCSANVIDYKDNQLKQWDFSIATKNAIFDAIRNNGSVSKENPITNFKMQVERIGASKETVYKITIAREATKLTDDENSLMADMKSIVEGFKVLSVSELRGFITGESESENREVNVDDGDTFDTAVEEPKAEKKSDPVVETPKEEKKKEATKIKPLEDEEDLF